MKIGIMGSGGVGGYFGARLAAAGHEVTFIARGAHLAAIRSGGLRVTSPLGDLHLSDARATDDPAEVGPVDVVLFAVKLWDTETAAQACRPMVGADTAVVPFQNGVSSMDVLARVLGADHVMGGVAQIAAVISEPGVISHNGDFARLLFGEDDGSRSDRVMALDGALKEAGVESHVVDDIRLALWEKFVFLSSFSALTAVCRSPIGPIREDPDMRKVLVACIQEAVRAGAAEGVRFRDGVVEKTINFADGVPAVMKSSMLEDLERGKRLEVPWLSGEVVRLADKHGFDAPSHRAIHAALKLFAEGTRSR